MRTIAYALFATALGVMLCACGSSSGDSDLSTKSIKGEYVASGIWGYARYNDIIAAQVMGDYDGQGAMEQVFNGSSQLAVVTTADISTRADGFLDMAMVQPGTGQYRDFQLLATPDGSVCVRADSDDTDNNTGMLVTVKRKLADTKDVADLSGDFAGFFVIMGSDFTSMSSSLRDMAFDGKGAGSYTYQGTTKSIDYSLSNTSWLSMNMNTDTGYDTDVEFDGGLDPDGGFFFLSDVEEDHGQVAVIAGVKKSSGRTVADLSGTYASMAYGMDSMQKKAYPVRTVYTFNGDGSASRTMEHGGQSMTVDFTYTVADDGEITFLSDGAEAFQGWLDPSGDVFATLSVSHLGTAVTTLEVGVRFPEPLEVADVQGDYCGGGVNMGKTRFASLLSIDSIDGGGNAGVRLRTSGSKLWTLEGEYEAVKDGTMFQTLNMPDKTTSTAECVVHSSADVFVGVDSDETDNTNSMFVTVKKSSGKTDSSLSGTYMGTGVAGPPEGESFMDYLVAADFHGNGSAQIVMAVPDMPIHPASMTYEMKDDGTFVMVSDDGGHVIQGVLSPDKSLVVMVDNEPTEDVVMLMTAFKKSSGMTMEDLEGSFSGCSVFSMADGTVRGVGTSDYTFDGQGGGWVSQTIGDDTFISSFTYEVADNGAITFTTPSGRMYLGQLSSDAKMFTLYDSNNEMGTEGTEFAIKRKN